MPAASSAGLAPHPLAGNRASYRADPFSSETAPISYELATCASERLSLRHMSNNKDYDRTDPPGPFDRIADLARAVLRSRGLREEQIDALLTRPRAPDKLRPDDNRR